MQLSSANAVLNLCKLDLRKRIARLRNFYLKLMEIMPIVLFLYYTFA